MRTKVTLILVLLNAALFAFIFFFEREWRAERAALQVRKRVLGPESAGIDTLTLSGPGGSLRLEREPNSDLWTLTTPIRWPANTFAVSRILTQLQLLEHDTSFSLAEAERSGQTLADFGLAEPGLTLTYTAPSTIPGAPPLGGTLIIGRATAVGSRLYVRTGDRIHVINANLIANLPLTPADVLSDAVFTIPVFEVRSLNLQTSATAARLRLRREHARWMFEAPIVARASKTDTELTINDLNALRVTRFLETTAATTNDRTGLGPNALRITLEGNNRRETLLIGNPVSADAPKENNDEHTERYARLEKPLNETRRDADRPDVLFTTRVNPRLITTLNDAQTNLRDKNILDLETRDIVALTLSAPAIPSAPEITLQHIEGSTPDTGWQLLRRDPSPASSAATTTTPADSPRVARLVQDITLLQAQRFVNDAPSKADLETYGFNLPERILTLTLAPPVGSIAASPGTLPATGTLVLEFGRSAAADRSLYARLVGQPFIYEVSPEIANLPVDPLAYRERTLQILPASTPLARLTLTTADGDKTIYDRTLAPGETWDKALAAEPEARRAALTQLLAQVPRIEARAITRERFARTVTVNGRERPWAWRLDLTPGTPGSLPNTPPSPSPAGAPPPPLPPSRSSLPNAQEAPPSSSAPPPPASTSSLRPRKPSSTPSGRSFTPTATPALTATRPSRLRPLPLSLGPPKSCQPRPHQPPPPRTKASNRRHYPQKHPHPSRIPSFRTPRYENSTPSLRFPRHIVPCACVRARVRLRGPVRTPCRRARHQRPKHPDHQRRRQAERLPIHQPHRVFRRPRQPRPPKSPLLFFNGRQH
ncbi:DUF4340 domain-containing protein [Geminisphaera colitermitum]|uniref:DUF4340 domain-containing protein n=1 Tax=Geminisphaera colitermitum TaxID=1148786 RepID=UPI0005BD84D3|nr:DUF4340 domain-containing protein [Geminisphaera colitermitum]